jgi:hypothetical protein
MRALLLNGTNLKGHCQQVWQIKYTHLKIS